MRDSGGPCNFFSMNFARIIGILAAAGAAVLGSAASARAQTLPKPVVLEGAGGDWKLTLGCWVDAYFGYNFNDPASRTDTVRVFDSRHDSFAIQIAAVDLQFEGHAGQGTAIARVTLQAGDEPEAYYLASGSETAKDAAANRDAFRHLQQAFAGYKLPMPGGDDAALEVDMGLFVSHIGYEGLNAKDNIHFSRSLLFQLTPFYATGARAIYTVSHTFTAQLNVTNGWNSVVDNNRSKSFGAQLVWAPSDRVSATLNWLGGAEQDATLSMRNLFDASLVVKPTDALMLAVNGHAGFDKVHPGTVTNGAILTGEERAAWYGVAGYGRYQITDAWAAGLRVEAFHDEVGVPWEAGYAGTIGEGTATIETRPQEHLILRFEVRHDEATSGLYETSSPPRLSRAQTTGTIGAIAFF
jgi:hypothetical protein